MDGARNAAWLKSDAARKKFLLSWSTTYFNLDHSQSKALLQWNGKVLDETSKFSVQDFVLSQDSHSSRMMGVGETKPSSRDIEAGRDAERERDVLLNLSHNNREDDYYRMNGQSATREQGQNGQNQEPYVYQQTDQQPVYGDGSDTPDDDESSSQRDKKKKGLKKSKFNGWANVKARNHFITKVLLIVMALLTYNLLIMIPFLFVETLKKFCQEHWWIYIVFFGCFLAFAIPLGCCPSVSRKSPGNYIMLFFASTFLGLAMGAIAANYEVEEVMMALGATILIVLILAIIAVFSPCDFTMLIGIVVVIALCFFFFGIMMIWYQSRILTIVYCTIGILIASLFIVIDIQMICGGKNRRYQYSEKDYVLASLSLYIDVTTLFMMILGLTGAANG